MRRSHRAGARCCAARSCAGAWKQSRRLVGDDLDAPGVGRDGGDLALVEPSGALDGESRRGAPAVALPGALDWRWRVIMPVRTRSDVAGLDRSRRRTPRSRRDAGAGCASPSSSHVTASVKRGRSRSTPRPTTPSRDLLDGVGLGAPRLVTRADVATVVHLAVVEHVREGIPLGAALERHLRPRRRRSGSRPPGSPGRRQRVLRRRRAWCGSGCAPAHAGLRAVARRRGGRRR